MRSLSPTARSTGAASHKKPSISSGNTRFSGSTPNGIRIEPPARRAAAYRQGQRWRGERPATTPTSGGTNEHRHELVPRGRPPAGDDRGHVPARRVRAGDQRGRTAGIGPVDEGAARPRAAHSPLPAAQAPGLGAHQSSRFRRPVVAATRRRASPSVASVLRYESSCVLAQLASRHPRVRSLTGEPQGSRVEMKTERF